MIAWDRTTFLAPYLAVLRSPVYSTTTHCSSYKYVSPNASTVHMIDVNEATGYSSNSFGRCTGDPLVQAQVAKVGSSM